MSEPGTINNEEPSNLIPIKAVVKVLISVICLPIPVGMILAHSIYNLTDPTNNDYDRATIISAEGELLKFVEKYHRDTQFMNFFEIVVWVIVPTLLIGWVIFLISSKSRHQKKLVILGLPLSIFLIAQITNSLGVVKILSERKPVWKEMFSLVKDKNVASYSVRISTGSSWEGGKSGTIGYNIKSEGVAENLRTKLTGKGFEHSVSESIDYYCKGMILVAIYQGSSVSASTDFSNEAYCPAS